MIQHRFAFLFAFALTGLTVASNAIAAPVIVPPVIAIINRPNPNTFDFVSVSIMGSDFGPATIGVRLRVRDTVTGATRNYAANDADHIVTWEPNRIVAKLPDTFLHPQVWVQRNDTNTQCATVTATRYDYFRYETNKEGTPAYTPEGDARPIALAVKHPRVYLLEEFHSALKYYENSTVFKSASAAYPDTTGFTQNALQPPSPMAISQLGESVLVGDPTTNRIWFSQGGGSLYSGTYPNHSRVVSYASGTLKFYKLPGDNNEVQGIAWDQNRNRIWYARGVRTNPTVAYGLFPARRGQIVGFDPDFIDSASYTGTYADVLAGVTCDGGDWATSEAGTCSNAPAIGCFTKEDCALADKICPPGTPETTKTCFHEYQLPVAGTPVGSGVAIVGHVMVASDGAVWYTAYTGWQRLDADADGFIGETDPDAGYAFIGRFNPTTGEDRHFPLHAHPDANYFNTGPWGISQTSNGDIIVSEWEEHAIARLDGTRINDPACQTLTSPTTNCALNGAPDATCQNPCIDTRSPLGFPGVSQLMHSVAEDAAGNVWFSQGAAISDLRYASTIGYWKADKSSLVTFPTPSLYVENNAMACPSGYRGFLGSEIAVNKINGDVWVADFCTKLLWRAKLSN